MDQAKTKPFEDWVLYVTNHFTHPVVEAQAASPRYHLARKLSEKGQKLLVYCPLGRHVGSPFRDFLTNLFPKRVTSGNTVYLFPPVIVSPASATTALTLVMGTLFILAYLSLSRIRVAAQYSTTMLVASVSAVVRIRKKIPLVANYGDPDFARERGLSLRAFRFCENLVLTRRNAHSIVYVDEVIGEYLRDEFRFPRTEFLPNGGYEKGSPLTRSDAAEAEIRDRLGLTSKRVVIYAGQISSGYRIDVLAPAAAIVAPKVPDAVFLMIGGGAGLPGLIREVRRLGLGESFRFTGPVPYGQLGGYLALSDVGLQVLNDMCMGTKVLMYMANRVAVVSAGGWYDRYHEFLRNGENALLVPPDGARLASAVVELLQSPEKRGRLEEAAWTSVQPYSWDHHAEKTMALLAEAAGERRGRS